MKKKACYRCKENLSLSEFSKRKDSLSGYRGVCKDCVKIKLDSNEVVAERKELRKKGKRRCNECKNIKKLDSNNFFQRNSEKDGWSVICRNCGAKRKRNENYFKYLHPTENRPFTDDDASLMIQNQKGKCLICEEKLILKMNLYGVDHCHKTMVVRGVLCSGCNTGLGKFKDSPELLQKAVDYLL